MICCTKCFKDPEVRALIESLKIKGDCPTCGSKNVYLYDVDANNSLEELFDGLLDVYTAKVSLPSSFPKGKTNMLKDELFYKWNIFSLEKDKIYTLIKAICHRKYTDHPEIFDDPVGIVEEVNIDYLDEYSILKTFEWNSFLKSIKFESRFHTNYINTEVLNLFCEYVIKQYKKGQMFYRARISIPDGYAPSQMGAPPAGEASAGRANPYGISYLYLASEKEVTFNEIRAGAYDYVTVGTFELQRDIKVINLAALDKISPFTEIDFTQHAINKEHLKRISNEIAKPLRRQDSPLDYLPTQYISDFIKSKGYDGIQYKSTMCKNGYNLAVFNENLCMCTSVETYEIKGVNYDRDKVE